MLKEIGIYFHQSDHVAIVTSVFGRNYDFHVDLSWELGYSCEPV